MRGKFRRESVEGRRNDASQPYRFGSRSVPRRSFSFDFAELVSPHTHTLRRLSAHPYIESGNRFSVLMYRPRVSRRPQPRCTGQTQLLTREAGVARGTGAPGGTRTPDPLLRRQMLYPAELRARCLFEEVSLQINLS